MSADLVFTGGSVFTPGGATAVAVNRGRVIAVGGAEVEQLIGPSTEVVSLAGRLLVPGFQDAHVHPLGGGQSLMLCNLREAGTERDAVAEVARYAAMHPELPWLVGGGWYMSMFPGGRQPRARSTLP